MIVAYSLEELEGVLAGCCLTIGNFDGVHMAHQKLLTRTRERGRTTGLASVAMTFEPHPRRVLLGKDAPPRLTTLEIKLELMADLGIEACFVAPFTRSLASLEPEDFVRQYLVEGLGACELIIGHDWAFGKGRRGDYETLRALGQKFGYSVERISPVLIDDAVVSSTRVRDMLSAGDVWDTKPLLGRFHMVRGTVVHGAGRGGALLGFPTANLDAPDQMLPRIGVYACWASLRGEALPAVANIGKNPTFDGETLTVEAHIMDFREDLYGQTLDLHFVQRLRAEKKFSGVDELKARITEDVALARRILEAAEAEL